jgi:hypothetical protein
MLPFAKKDGTLRLCRKLTSMFPVAGSGQQNQCELEQWRDQICGAARYFLVIRGQLKTKRVAPQARRAGCGPTGIIVASYILTLTHVIPELSIFAQD